MFQRTLEILFKPSIAIATKLSRLFAPEAPKAVHYHRQARRFKTSSRRIRSVS